MLLHASLSQSVIEISKEMDTVLYKAVTMYKLHFSKDDLLKIEGLEAKRLPGIEEMQAAPDNPDSAPGVMNNYHEICQILKTAVNARVWRDFLQTSRTTGNARVLQDLFPRPRSAIQHESPIAPLNPLNPEPANSEIAPLNPLSPEPANSEIAPLNPLNPEPANSEIEPAQESRTPTTLVRGDQHVYNRPVTRKWALVDIGDIHINCSPGCSTVSLAATAVVLASCCIAYSAYKLKNFTPDELVSDVKTQESNKVKGVFANLRLFCKTPEDVSLMCQLENLVLGEEDKKHGSNTAQNLTNGEARNETDAEEEQSGADEGKPLFEHRTGSTADGPTEDPVETPLEMSSAYVEKAIGVLAPFIKRISDSKYYSSVLGIAAVGLYIANAMGNNGEVDVDAMMRSGAGMEALFQSSGYVGATTAANKLDIPARTCAANASDTP